MTTLRTILMEQTLWRIRLIRVHEATLRRLEYRIKMIGTKLKGENP